MQRRSGRIDGQVLANPGGDLRLAGMRFGGEQALVEVLRIALQGDHVQRGDTGRQLQQVIGTGVGQAGEAGHHRGAVHQRQRLLGAQGQRRPAELAMHFGGAAAFTAIQHLTLAGERCSDIGQRGQVAAGTDRTFLRNQRQHVVFEKCLHALQQLDAHAGHAVGQRTQASGEHGAGGFGVQQLAQAATMKGEQVLRQRFDLMQWHRYHAGIAIAGGDAIDHAFAVQQGVEKLRAAGDAAAKDFVRLQSCRRTALRHGQHVLDAQKVFAKDHGLSHDAGPVCSRRDRS